MSLENFNLIDIYMIQLEEKRFIKALEIEILWKKMKWDFII